MNHRLLTFLLVATLPGSGFAQSETATTAKVVPHYDVEVVIFKNVTAPKSREFILPVSSPSKDKKILDLSSASSVKAAVKMGYQILPEKTYRLREVVDKLVTSPRYELLLHASWRQPGLEKAQVLPVWVRGGRIYGNEYTSIDNQIELLDSNSETGSNENSAGKTYQFDEQTLESQELQLLEQQNSQRHRGLYELEGKITIALSRYLHTYTDLVLRRPRLSIDPVLSSSVQNRLPITYSADTRILNNHSLKEHRRMRSKNLHYLDNPEFAMLILITPYKVPEKFEEAPLEAEPTASE